MKDQTPVHVSLTVGPTGTDPRSRIIVGGVDLTTHCRGFTVEAGVGAITAVWLDLIGVTVDVQADVPPDYIKEVTLEDEAANEEARQTRDVDRGNRQPRALLAVSLGQVKA